MTSLEDVLKNFEQRLNSIEEQLRQVQHLPQESEYHHRNLTRDVSQEEISAPSLDSSTMLAWIGIVFVILAGVFFIKLTIDSGWLTPIRQVVFAAATGVIFFFLPHILPKAEREYGAWLAGAGITILHLTWPAAYLYHRILDPFWALICATAVGFFAIWSNFDRGNRVYILVALAGTYLSAPIIAHKIGDLTNVSIFLIIWNISFSVAAFMQKRRDIIFIASCYALFTVLLLSGITNARNLYTELFILQMAQFIIFSGVMVSFSIYYQEPLADDESNALLPLLLLFYFSTGHLIAPLSPGLTSWFGILVGVFVLGLYFCARVLLQRELKSGKNVALFVAITFVHSFYFQLLSETFRPLAALLIGAGIIALGYKNFGLYKKFYGPLMVLLATVLYGAILTIVDAKSINNMYLYNFAYGFVALVAVIGLSAAQDVKVDSQRYLPLLMSFAHIEVMLGFYRFSQDLTWPGGLFVTITWGIYAVFVLALAYWRKDQTLGNSALTILIAVGLKAFLYDAIESSNLIKILCLLAAGLLLYCCGWVFKKMQDWKS